MSALSRKQHLADKIVFVDGLPGCGKTLFSNIISGMDRVELLSYSYEIEHICALQYLDKMPMETAINMVRMQTDLKLYNVMMGRDVNFRPTDLSSAINNHNTSRYFQRLFAPGDEIIPENIKKERPILNFSVHNMLVNSNPIWRALGSRCIFIEIVRHPLYMIRQQALNMENLFENVRNFTVCFEYKGRELPYYVRGWEERYLESNALEKAIYFIDELTRKTEKIKREFKKNNNIKILTIPFEPFVLDPEIWMKKISTEIGAKITSATERVMSEQKIPRDKVSAGLDIGIYRRCGWTVPIDGATESDELNIRRIDVANNVNKHALSTFDNLIEKYEKNYWKP